MNVNIALHFFLMGFRFKKKKSHIDDILEGK